jgi:hypothetical protein
MELKSGVGDFTPLHLCASASGACSCRINLVNN